MTSFGARPTFVVSGPIANKPSNGGIAWVPISYVAGLEQLGYVSCFVEQIAESDCRDLAGRACEPESSVNLAHFVRVVTETGLRQRAALFVTRAGDPPVLQRLSGPPLEELGWGAKDKVLLNLSGHLSWPQLREGFARQIYIDLDPGFTQLWEAEGDSAPRLSGHDVYFTVGANIGTSRCRFPRGGIKWRPTRPPVVLRDWPVCSTPGDVRFTTVSSWRGALGPRDYFGQRCGGKVFEFRKFLELPRLGKVPLEIALDIHPADVSDVRRLGEAGWRVVDPVQVAATPLQFRQYVQHSGAEFSVADGLYVHSNSGWFSDRTARYLASGKPALVQETGLADLYNIGEGFLTFRNLDEAAVGLEAIRGNYRAHSRAARALAEKHFDAVTVLSELLEEAGAA